MFYVSSYVFAYEKEGIMYLRGRSMREIAIESQISQEFINDLFNSCKELLEIEEVLGSELTFELLNEQILISDEIDIDSRYSRTKGYYSLFYDEDYKNVNSIQHIRHLLNHFFLSIDAYKGFGYFLL